MSLRLGHCSKRISNVIMTQQQIRYNDEAKTPVIFR